VTFDEVDYGDATLVPVAGRPVGVEITWNVTREALAAGVGYTLDLAQGDVSMSGTVGDSSIGGVTSASMLCDSRVTQLTCTPRVDGGLDLAWENHEFADESQAIQLLVNGADAGTVPGTATNAAFEAGDLEDGFNQVCLVNSSGLPTCCGYFSGTATPIHHWEFEGDLEDSVGDAEGTAYNLADLTEDARIGEGALLLNGSGDYVEVVDRDSLKFAVTDSYSIAAWVKPAFALGGSWRGVVTKGRDAPPWFGIWINPSSQWNYGCSGNDIAGSQVTFDEWAHVTIVQNGPLGTRELYVDGALQGTEAAHDALNTGNLAMGGALSVDEWFTGVVDDVRVYDVPLDLAHIQALASGEVVEDPVFHRGDSNSDGIVNITDGIFVLNFLFLGGATPPCLEAANGNDDNVLNITDGIYILNFLFLGGASPPPPGPPSEACGPDPGVPNDLGCISYTGC
jgi:hypothetical protein